MPANACQCPLYKRAPSCARSLLLWNLQRPLAVQKHTPPPSSLLKPPATARFPDLPRHACRLSLAACKKWRGRVSATNAPQRATAALALAERVLPPSQLAEMALYCTSH